MRQLNLKDVYGYVSNNIGTFHKRRLAKLDALKLDDVLLRKNIYLFRAKNILTAQDFVKNLLDAYLSSQEEGLFGDFLEGLAIFVCGKVYGGTKSSAQGIDLEFVKENVRYIVTIKSGPNWGNSQQIKRMIDNFNQAKRTLHTSGSKIQIVAVNGCCYGRDNQPHKKDNYFKFCGQQFWEFISGNRDLYKEIVAPLGHKAKEKNQEFAEKYAQIINKFTTEFSKDFVSDGKIDWAALVAFNSATQKPNI